MPTFTHVDDEGRVRMVDVSEKAATVREAAAQGIITMQPETFDLARRTNMMLVGRVRQERMVVYNHGGRIAGL